MDNRYFVEAVAKSIDVLESFSSSTEELSIAEVVRRADVTYCSAFRLLYTLEQRGYVMRVAGSKKFRLVQAQKRYRIGYAALNQRCSYSTEISRGLAQAARNQGVGLVLRDNEYSPVRALFNAEALLEERVHLLVMHQPFEEVAEIIAARCRAAGVPLLAIDHAHAGSHYFGVEPPRAGRLAGQFLREAGHGRDRVLILLPAPANESRRAFAEGAVRGLRAAMGWNPAIEVLSVGGVRTDRHGLRGVLKDAKIASGRMLVAAACDSLAVAAGRALASLGCEATPIVGLGGSAESIARLRRSEDRIATVACFPETYGERVIRMAIRILQGQQPGRTCFTEHVLLTAGNLAQCYPDARHLGPVRLFRGESPVLKERVQAAG